MNNDELRGHALAADARADFWHSLAMELLRHFYTATDQAFIYAAPLPTERYQEIHATIQAFNKRRAAEGREALLAERDTFHETADALRIMYRDTLDLMEQAGMDIAPLQAVFTVVVRGLPEWPPKTVTPAQLPAEGQG